MNIKSTVKKHAFSSFLTLFILSILLIIGPSSLMAITFNISNMQVYENDVAQFDASVQVNSAERLTVREFNLIINPYEEDQLPILCSFDSQGQKIDCDDSIISIERVYDETLGYGYNYGYGYGYGYGYDSDSEDNFKFRIKWKTPSVEENKDYYVNFKALTNEGISTSEDTLMIEVLNYNFTHTETVENADFSKLAYTTGSYIGDYNQEWSYTNSRLYDNIYSIDNQGILFGVKSKNSTFETTLDNGLDGLLIHMKKAYTSENDRKIEVFINGVSYGKSESIKDLGKTYTFFIKDLKLEGKVNIKIKNLDDQIVIDNIQWNEYQTISNPIITLSGGRGTGGGSGFESLVFIKPTNETDSTNQTQKNNINTSNTNSTKNNNNYQNQTGNYTQGQNNNQDDNAPLGLGGLVTGNLPSILGVLVGLLLIGGIVVFAIKK